MFRQRICGGCRTDNVPEERLGAIGSRQLGRPDGLKLEKCNGRPWNPSPGDPDDGRAHIERMFATAPIWVRSPAHPPSQFSLDHIGKHRATMFVGKLAFLNKAHLDAMGKTEEGQARLAAKVKAAVIKQFGDT